MGYLEELYSLLEVSDVKKSIKNNKNRLYYKSYLEIIKNAAELCYKLKLDNTPYDVSIFFEYLLWYGYFSYNHELYFSAENRKNNSACYGADIMCGKSVCINNSDMLKRIYQELGYEAYLLGVYLECDLDGEVPYKFEIERNYIPTGHEFDKEKIGDILYDKLVSKNIGNHAVTLVNGGENYEIIDSTNLSLMSISPNLTAQFLGGEKSFPIKFGIMLTDLNVDKFIVNNVIQDIKDDKTSKYDIGRIKLRERINTLILEKNRNKLEEFYEDNLHYINRVALTLRK